MFGYIGACVTLGPSAWGQVESRSALAGFGEIRFGMTEADLRRSVTVLDDIDNVEGGRWLTGRALIDIAGGRFALKVLIDHGTVRRISLLDLAPVPTPDCRPGFYRMVEYVEAQYGAADSKGKDVPQIIRESYTAKFNFADGAQIEVGTFLNGNGKECGNSIVFFMAQDAPRDESHAPSDA